MKISVEKYNNVQGLIAYRLWNFAVQIAKLRQEPNEERRRILISQIVAYRRNNFLRHNGSADNVLDLDDMLIEIGTLPETEKTGCEEGPIAYRLWDFAAQLQELRRKPNYERRQFLISQVANYKDSLFLRNNGTDKDVSELDDMLYDLETMS